jgi:hypothetical protein
MKLMLKYSKGNNTARIQTISHWLALYFRNALQYLAPQNQITKSSMIKSS